MTCLFGLPTIATIFLTLWGTLQGEGGTGGTSAGMLSAALSAVIGLAFLLPFAAVGLGLLVWAIWPWIASLRVARPQVSISNDQLRVGEEFGLVYQQSFKSAVDVNRFAIQLVLHESATYRRGTNTYTATYDHVIQQLDLPARHFDAGEVFAQRQTLAIPPNAMHSFSAYRNRLSWLIRLHVSIPGWPDFKQDYPVTVLAERWA
jgi:hypothetical protein